MATRAPRTKPEQEDPRRKSPAELEDRERHEASARRVAERESLFSQLLRALRLSKGRPDSKWKDR